MTAPSPDRELIDRYQALVEHSADIITLVDAEGTIAYQSPSAAAVLGYEPESLEGAALFDYLHPDDRERALEDLTALLADESAATVTETYRFRHADGHWVWLEGRAVDRTDTPLGGIVVNTRDVTERLARERELAEEREKYVTVVEHSNDAVIIVRDWTVRFANRRARELMGVEDLTGRTIGEFVDPSDLDRVRERYERRVDPDAEDPPERYEVRFRTEDGRVLVGEVNVATITYEEEPSRLVTIRDVTDRVRFEERLETVAEELEALNRVVRHDIRNDMSVVLGWARLLEPHVDEEGREQLDRIIASSERVVELTDVARDYVESLTGEAGPATKPVSLRSVLELELTLRRETYPEATFVGPERVPDVDVRANEMLASVFRNLLNNAVQHHDGDAPRVEVTVAVEDDAAVVAVADDGPGIPAERRDAVFGKGDRDDDSAGTGMGLYLVRSLVEGYGGSVRVEPNEPRGARFVVRLPLAE